MNRSLNRILELLEKPINWFLWVAILGGVLMMLHVTLDVAGRTLFNHPIEGTTEIVSAWYMVAVAYLAWAWIARHDRHIHVDMFTMRLPARPRFWLDIVVKAVTALYVALFTWRTVKRAITQTELGEVWLAGTKYIPVWPSRWVLPIAGALMVIYLVVRIAADLSGQSKSDLGD
jgi:TRAP-type C4-dicarboxylate transport system permease small subunit